MAAVVGSFAVHALLNALFPCGVFIWALNNFREFNVVLVFNVPSLTVRKRRSLKALLAVYLLFALWPCYEVMHRDLATKCTLIVLTLGVACWLAEANNGMAVAVAWLRESRYSRYVPLFEEVWREDASCVVFTVTGILLWLAWIPMYYNHHLARHHDRVDDVGNTRLWNDPSVVAALVLNAWAAVLRHAIVGTRPTSERLERREPPRLRRVRAGRQLPRLRGVRIAPRESKRKRRKSFVPV